VLRLSLLASAAAAVALLAAGSSGGAPSAVGIGTFEGVWNADSSSKPPVQSESFVIEGASKAEATAKVGTFWTTAPNDLFTRYCGSGAQVTSYLVLDYSWKGGGSMGGCISDKTTPHIVYFGTKQDSGSSHVKTVDGKDVLAGDWGYLDNSGYHDSKFTAHHPTVKFSVVEQGHQALPKSKGAKFELTKAIGHGEFELTDNPRQLKQVTIAGASGKIRLRKWRVFAHGVQSIFEDDLVLRMRPGGHYEEGNKGVVLGRVTVTKVDPEETDPCTPGSTGAVVLLDSGDRKKDALRIDISSCHVHEVFNNGLKGSKVAANLDEEP
jgi:hypothetical protein